MPEVAEVVVVGQIARDLVLRVDEVPESGGTAAVRERREMLGGKGANQAVGLAQLKIAPALVAVLGDDDTATALLDQARRDGIDTTHIVRRSGARTGLIIDIVTDGWRYLEDLPDELYLTEADVAAAEPAIRDAAAAVVQLQQPAATALKAARKARGLVVLDGAPTDLRDDLLNAADVLRADSHEAELLLDQDIDGPDDAVRLARELLEHHDLRFVVLAVRDYGDVFVWRDGRLCLPYRAAEVVDTTGAGDAMTAALTSVLCRGGDPAHAARLAAAAAAATVPHLGGRPDLTGLSP